MNYGQKFVTLNRKQIIPKKNKCKKAKWLSDEVLQIAKKRKKQKAKEKRKVTPI